MIQEAVQPPPISSVKKKQGEICYSWLQSPQAIPRILCVSLVLFLACASILLRCGVTFLVTSLLEWIVLALHSTGKKLAFVYSDILAQCDGKEVDMWN
jgi:hypothetical protein